MRDHHHRRFPRIPRVALATLDAGSATEMDCMVINASADGLLLELPAGRSCRKDHYHRLSVDGLELPVRIAWVKLGVGPSEGALAGVEIDCRRLDRATLRAFSQWVVSDMTRSLVQPSPPAVSAAYA